jgi:hypothetical protein
MKTRLLVTSLGFIFATSVIQPAFADMSVEFTSGARHHLAEEYFKATQEQGAFVSIVNLKDKTVKMPSKLNKSYVEMLPQDMCNTGEEALASVYKDLPAEQRERMEALLAHMKPTTTSSNRVEIINLGESDIIAGYKTTKYQVVFNGDIKEILWQTTDKAIMNEIGHLLTLSEEFSCNDKNDYQDSEQYKALSKKGFPLKTYLNDAANDESNNRFGQNEYSDYDDSDVEEVVSISFANIATSEFSIPAHYKKITMAEYQRDIQEMFANKHSQVGE